MDTEKKIYKAFTGRRQLFTDYLPNRMRRDGDTSPILDEESIPTIIKNVWDDVMTNGVETQYLLEYYKGKQDILDRNKVVRPDVDNRVVFNHAMAITRATVGYTFGKPIRYVHRKDTAREGVSELNLLVEAEDKFTSDQELAIYASVCGTGYRGVFADTYGVEDDIPFSVVTLDPVTTFIVYSTEIGHPPVLACTFYETPPSLTHGNKYVYLVYTHDYIYRYEIDSCSVGILSSADLVGEPIQNILGEIPIVEYPNNAFRIGDWEIAKPLLDAINVVGSDSVNDLEQYVNSILVAVNVELDAEGKRSIQDDKIVSIKSDKDLPAELKYISEQLDVGSAQELREFLIDQLGVIVGVPSRTDSSSGGDTGDAVYLRDGFQDLEIVARNKETFFKRAERNTLKLIVNLLTKKHYDPLISNLKTKDIDIRFSRNMTDGILAKANAISIMSGAQIFDPVDILSLVNISTEPDDLAKRGEDYWSKKTEADSTNEDADSDNTTDLKDELLNRTTDRD